MPYLSKDKVRQIIQNRPQGTTPEGIVAALRSQGHQLEGYPGQERGLLDPVPLEQGPSLGGFAKNAAKSAGRLASDVGSALMHPVQTAKMVASLPIGAAANAVETFTGNEQTFNAPGEEAATALGKNFVDRYGDQGIAKTLYEDPVGAASDVATALGAGGAVAKAAKFGKAGAELSKMATAIDPVANVSRGIGKTVEAGLNTGSKGLQAGAERLYQSALKPSKAVEKKNPNIAKVGLDIGIVVSQGGLQAVQNKIDDVNSLIDQKLGAATDKGVVIHTNDVIKALDDTKRFFSDTIGGSKIMDELDQLAETFRKERGKTIPVERAQTIKKNTYVRLRKAYGELKSAETEGTKALARGLKEEIAKKVKGIDPLNKTEGELIGLETALEDFVRRNGNKDILGLAGGVGAGAGAAAAGLAGAAKAGITARVVKAIFDNPTAKSQLAIFLNGMAGGAAFSGRTSRALGQLSEILRMGDSSFSE